MWNIIKKIYVNSPALIKILIILIYLIRKRAKKTIINIITLNFRKIFQNKIKRRGMSSIVDLIDWVGGYPYEYAKVNQILKLYQKDYKVLEIMETSIKLWEITFVFIKIIKLR